MEIVRLCLIGACLAAVVPLLWRTGEVAAELRREQQADAAYAHGVDRLIARDFDGAAQAFRKAITLAPSAADAYQSLAEAELRRGEPDAAIQAYRSLMTRYPFSYMSTLRLNVGLIELRAGRAGGARRDLQQAVELAPTDWLSFYFLGVAQYRLGHIREARAAWRRVLLLNPNFQPAHERLEHSGGTPP